MLVEQALQPRALRAVHRDQLVDPVVDARRRRREPARLRGAPGRRLRLKRVGVGGELQQRLDLHRAGQLGVGDLIPSPSRAPGSRRIRRSGRRTSRPGRSPARRRSIAARVWRRGRSQPRRRCTDGPADDGDVADSSRSCRGGAARARRRASRCARAGRRRRDPSAPAQLRVECAQQRVLAPRGGGEIRRAVDDLSPCHTVKNTLPL